MLFRVFEDEVRGAVNNALKEKGYTEPELELLVPNKEGQGDLSCRGVAQAGEGAEETANLDSKGAGSVDLRKRRARG